MIEKLDANYWQNRYQQSETGWDVGYPSTPLKEYFDQLKNKSLKILIPGCGNAYEAEYLYYQSFKNVYVIDIAPAAINNFKKRVPSFPVGQLILGDFFNHFDQYDLIIEQTFFCALDPKLRPTYAKKMHELLKPDGKLVGLLFDDHLNTDHPPFGGSKEEYIKYFEPYFNLTVFDTAYNSIQPRAERELFMILIKK